MASFFRRLGAQIAAFLVSAGDPSTNPSAYQLFTKSVSGTLQLFGVDSAGGVTQFTPQAVPASVTWAFGSGFDGALNFDGVSTVTLGDGTTVVPAGGVYSIARDIFATDMTVATTVQVKSQRYRIFCTGTLNLVGSGKIHQNGGAGGDGGNAVVGTGGTNSFGGSGVFTATGQGGSGGAAGAGGAGTQAAGNLKPLGAGTGAIAAGALGGRMQGGGGGSATSAGGTTPSNTGYDATTGGLDVFQQALYGRGYNGNQINTGTGGGGGGGSTAPSNSNGGGGGAPAGALLVAARLITGTGSIEAKGGNGGNGTFNNGGAGASGGGGGAGGIVILATTTNISTVTVSVAGGIGGTGIGASGVSGGNGGPGFFYANQL